LHNTEYLVGIQSAHFIAVIQLFSRLGLVIGNLNSVKGNNYFWFTDVNKTQIFLPSTGQGPIGQGPTGQGPTGQGCIYIYI
jgi:hypothetical protein